MKFDYRMSHQASIAASLPPPSQVHPMLRTLRTELCALEVEAIKFANQKQNRKSRYIKSFDYKQMCGKLTFQRLLACLYDNYLIHRLNDNINEINQLNTNKLNGKGYRTDEPPTLSIEDNNPILINFCKTLENIFHQGAIQEDKRNKFELIDLLLHIARKQNTGS